MKKILQRYSTLYSSLDVLKSVTTFEEVVLSFPVIFWFLGYHELFPKWCIYTALFLILWIQFKLDYTKYRLPRDLYAFIQKLESQKDELSEFINSSEKLLNLFEQESKNKDHSPLSSYIRPEFARHILSSDNPKELTDKEIVEDIKLAHREAMNDLSECSDTIYDAKHLLDRVLRKLNAE
jgi:hypothetical protein